jgi:GT2 family glycosyltransferase
MGSIMLSIVIATRDRQDALDKTLSTLSHGGHEYVRICDGVEFIVVDDASETRARDATGLAEIVRLPASIGAIRARNVGMRWAIGEYILTLDDDSVPTPLGVANAVCAMKRDESIGLVAFDVVPTDEPIMVDLVSAGPRLSARATGIGAEDVGAFSGCGMLIRREVMQDVGVWPEWQAGPFELDYTIRVLAAGWRVVRVPGAYVVHSPHPSSRPTEARNYGVPRRLLDLYVRHYPAKRAARGIVGVARRCALMSLETKSTLYLRALADGLAHLPWSERRVVSDAVLDRVRVPTALIGLAI